jgi:hypothetical protein
MALKKIPLALIIIAFSMLRIDAKDGPDAPGSIDWVRGVIVSHGTSRVMINDEGMPVDPESGAVISINRGRSDAYRKARERAMEEMVRMVKEIRIDPDTMLGDLLERSDTVQTRIVRVISGRVKTREYPVDYATTGCRAEIKIGDILPAVPYAYPAEGFPSRIDGPVPTRYTGLVIDTRGLHVEPMILPSIFNEDGLEIYGRTRIDIRYALKHGIAAYATSEDQAMKYRVAGDHPYYTVAVSELKGCPVLADRDVRKILGSAETVEQLKKCRVIFIIDKTKK